MNLNGKYREDYGLIYPNIILTIHYWLNNRLDYFVNKFFIRETLIVFVENKELFETNVLIAGNPTLILILAKKYIDNFNKNIKK